MIETHLHGEILEIRMARPPVNALNPELMTALTEAIRAAPQQARALVLSGRPGLFSAGLDVPTLLTLDRPALEDAWRRFYELLECLARSPIPTVAAIAGHSPAGGAVLSLFCDYRVMAAGDYRIGLNEVQVGLAVPVLIQDALRRLVGPHKAERLLVAGAMIGPEHAQQVGLIDEVQPLEQVLPRALEWLSQHLALPPVAMATTRAMARRDLVARFDDQSAFPISEFADLWFSAETQDTLRALVARLKAR